MYILSYCQYEWFHRKVKTLFLLEKEFIQQKVLRFKFDPVLIFNIKLLDNNRSMQKQLTGIEKWQTHTQCFDKKQDFLFLITKQKLSMKVAQLHEKSEEILL